MKENCVITNGEENENEGNNEEKDEKLKVKN